MAVRCTYVIAYIIYMIHIQLSIYIYTIYSYIYKIVFYSMLSTFLCLGIKTPTTCFWNIPIKKVEAMPSMMIFLFTLYARSQKMDTDSSYSCMSLSFFPLRGRAIFHPLLLDLVVWLALTNEIFQKWFKEKLEKCLCVGAALSWGCLSLSWGWKPFHRHVTNSDVWP